MFKLQKKTVEMINTENMTDDDVISCMKNRTAIFGKYAGAGKTYYCLKYVERNLKEDEFVLYVSPTNILKSKVQAKHKNFICKTTDSVLGYTNDDGIFTNEMNLEKQKVKVVIFDEIFMSSIRTLAKMKVFIEKNPNIIFFCTGDPNQNKPVEFPYNNVSNYKQYLTNAITELFPRVITLTSIHRQKKEDQKMKHKAFHQDIFNESIPVMETLTKYFKDNFVYTYDNLSKQNICYFKFRRDIIIDKIKKQNNKAKPYEVGDQILVTKQFSIKSDTKKKSSIVFNPNNYYNILEIDGIRFKIEHAIDKEKVYTLPVKHLKENFILFYCSTCHSIQGDTMEGLTTIFDINTPYVSREWIYTAITRITDFDDLRIFIHSNTSVQNLESSKVRQYLSFKLQGYKEQDKKSDRICDVITLDETLKKLEDKNECSICREKFYFFLKNGDVLSNFTLDRLNNEEGHHLDNCRVCCLDCNRKLMDKELF